ncbi:MAG: hypothetical protein K8T25_17570, partial [Planctomycetia bacterium]|nr:hypothetical protein [Planctomycetia bacterium]
ALRRGRSEKISNFFFFVDSTCGWHTFCLRRALRAHAAMSSRAPRRNTQRNAAQHFLPSFFDVFVLSHFVARFHRAPRRASRCAANELIHSAIARRCAPRRVLQSAKIFARRS